MSRKPYVSNLPRREQLALAMERMEGRISPEPNSGCWIWTGFSNSKGYAYFYFGGKTHRVTRVVLEYKLGYMPDDMQACHKCDNTYCVNPDHLFIGTNLENQQYRARKFRHHFSQLSPDQVILIRQEPVTLSGYALARKYGISIRAAYDCRNGRSYQHVK